MSKLEFNPIVIKNIILVLLLWDASIKLENCEILQREETNYVYQKAVVKLSPEKLINMKKNEEEVNEHLRYTGLSIITLVYGNRVYPKIKIDNPKTIKLKSVWINVEKKPVAGLWLE